MAIHIGCAVWSFPGWTGDIFPTGTRSKDYLSLYSRYFPAVEGNTTFYAVPPVKTLEKWQAETPADFRFCLKLPRDFTHSGLLVPQLPKAIDFLELVDEVLVEKLGMVFVQLPPGYQPKKMPDLSKFLTNLVKVGVPLALEVRNLEWFEPGASADLQKMLAGLGIDQVTLDTQAIYQTAADPEYPFICKKPLVPLLTAPTSMIRYVSHPRLEVNRPFMLAWAERLQEKQLHEQPGDTYFFIHCPIEEKSPQNARYFRQILQEQGLEVHDLPWQAPATEQLGLNLQ
jgi:uncharacterized protein YecE (DUF72 family)